METLVIKAKNKSQSEIFKALAKEMKLEIEELESLEDKAFGKMLDEGKKSRFMSDKEVEKMFSKLGEKMKNGA